MAGTGSTSLGAGQIRKLLASRNIERVVVLGANGTMGFGSGALFTQAVPHVTFLARSRAKAEEGIESAISQVRSPTVATIESSLRAASTRSNISFLRAMSSVRASKIRSALPIAASRSFS